MGIARKKVYVKAKFPFPHIVAISILNSSAYIFFLDLARGLGFFVTLSCSSYFDYKDVVS